MTWRSGCTGVQGLEFDCAKAGDYVNVAFDVPQGARRVKVTLILGAEYLLDGTVIESGRTACEQGTTTTHDEAVQPGPHTLIMIAIDVTPPNGTSCGFKVGITDPIAER